MQKGARGWGQEGWGKGARGWNLYLNEVLNKTGIVTHLGCHNKRYNTKSYTKSGESPILEGFPHCNDITFSKIRHNLAKKVRKRDVREISQEEEGVMADIASLKAFKTQILKKLDNHSGRKLKYEQF